MLTQHNDEMESMLIRDEVQTTYELPEHKTPSAVEQARPFECNKVSSRTSDVNAGSPKTVVLMSLLEFSSLAFMIVEESSEVYKRVPRLICLGTPEFPRTDHVALQAPTSIPIKLRLNLLANHSFLS